MTTVGPHRDDFCIRTNGLDLGCYGSRGQIRTAMLSLKIAEMMWMQEKTHEHPILMFDEVLAELDQERREALLESIHLSEQVLCTTTDLNLFNKNFLQHSDIWQINQGNLSFFKL
jgi:DNA replication and repair protein RecF